jgi:cyclic beta-1,2-glucan synthetase
MNVNTSPIEDLLSPLKQYFQKDNFSREDVISKPPLRSELLTAEQMDQYARQLAAHHAITDKQMPEKLLRRLAENEEVIFRVIALLHESVREKRPVTPAGEWLLDNFYLIEEEIKTGKRYLPKGYSKGLPKLVSGQQEGYPRVYDIAIEIISHSDGHVDIHSLSGFIAAYQTVSQLTIGELWAIPIMLRLALLENLRRVAERTAVDRIDATLAGHWANLIIETAEHNPKDLILVIADMARSHPPMVSAFVAEFARKLQWKGHDLTLPLNWIEQQLSGTSHTINTMVLAENQQQAADQLSVSNSINSLRFLSKMDWREFVETMSVVEQTLRMDADYPQMDFATRDYYRHQVEGIAKRSNRSENDVARIALDLARLARESEPDYPRSHHVGYYLVSKGRKKTEEAAAVRPTMFERIEDGCASQRKLLYFLGITLLTATVGYVGFELLPDEWQSSWRGVVVVLMFLLTGSQFAVAIVNWLSTILVLPKPLPKMNFVGGVPVEARTLVAVPTLISGKQQCDKLARDLEVRYLANRDPNIFFALLTDFTDAPREHMPEDEPLLNRIKTRISELNSRYGNQDYHPFLLFHRPRVYNEHDKKWMGFERKRGKLSDLNRVLRGTGQDKFSVIIGDERIYHTVKYVITLDSDTLLPRDAAWKLAGVMSHPLNRPVYSEYKQRITEGYGVVQPRVAISLHGSIRSPFAILNESDSGIDPYTQVTSDVYQDVFDEGSFIGKGIYDVDAFEKVLGNRFPKNRILSHDLLEGSYIRSGFASDIQLYEAYPERYEQDVARRHRWIRGDWQIAAWATPWIPLTSGKWGTNPISWFSRWKIFDNLRRSLVTAALMLQLVLGWTILNPPWLWTLLTLGLVVIPSTANTLRNAFRKPKEIRFRHHLNNTVGATHKTILQTLFTLACLPYEAYVSLSAVLTTLWRMHVSKRNLLEWAPAGIGRTGKNTPGGVLAKMWFAPALSIALTLLLIQKYPASLTWAMPFLLVWFASPIIVWLVSREKEVRKAHLHSEDKKYLRILGRRTWAFFEQHVTQEENWLPPDNLQQYPVPVIAHRTSPTNIGMSLLSALAAHDFGWLGTRGLLTIIGNTFSTLDRLERYKGHFYNWYDTQTLEVLRPNYISSVDSGNLAGHLHTLRQGLLELPHRKVIEQNRFDGLSDILAIMDEVISKEERARLRQFEETFRDNLPSLPFTIAAVRDFLDNTETSFRESMNLERFPIESEAGFWVHTFLKQLQDIRDELAHVAPWISLEPPSSKIAEILTDLNELPALLASVNSDARWKTMIRSARQSTPLTTQETKWLADLETMREQAVKNSQDTLSNLRTLANKCLDFADVEYDFLFDKAQRLISIGYSVHERHRDASFYDLLASEARLSNFVGIAQGKLPEESWFSLGRRLTSTAGSQVLLSWSGSMFEYLMPMLVMPTYENTLLEETCKGAVDRQIEYGEQQNVPWGISESCYNLVDGALNYQYRAFGVPGLGFKRGLGHDLVIAPYASVMALMVRPQAAMANLKKLRELGFEGRYGFYESIDYTPERLSRGQKRALIQTFMAHHQGMSLLSIAYLLLDKPMQRRFENDPGFQASLLLLQEQIPKITSHYESIGDTEDVAPSAHTSDIRVIKALDGAVPEVQLLSNGRYHVMVTQAGGGYSRCRQTALTRWREDSTCDNWGTFCYIRDLESGKYWSSSYQPTCQPAKSYEAIFSQGRAEFRRRDQELETYTEIIVSPEDDIEVRRVHLVNHSKSVRQVEITSYSEVVLALPVADDSHPAFSNLFVQTEINNAQNVILCTRRPRSHDERPPWMLHLMKVNGKAISEPTYETDRSKFVGRGRTPRNPIVMEHDNGLSGSQGSVLDPIVSIQFRLTIEAGDTASVDLITGISSTRDGAQALVDKYQDRHLRDRAFELSWTHSQVVLRQIGAAESDAQLFGKLASSVIYMNPVMRGNPNTLIRNTRGQSALWSYSISGDLPIVLLQVSNSSNIHIIRQMILAQAYWHLKGLAVDLIILNEDPSGYRQVLQDQIQGLIAAGIGINASEKQGRIFVRSLDQVSTEDLVLFQTVARVIISDSKGSLAEQVNKRLVPKAIVPQLLPSRSNPDPTERISPVTDLDFFNGTGGFSKDGHEYVINVSERRQTPLPWANVIANRNFGTIVTESGPGYTWSENAHEFRLTPWHNDPISNHSGEAFYLRDEETGRFWSPTLLPCGSGNYTVRHGFGYSVYLHEQEGIVSELTIFIDIEESIRFSVLRITNRSGRKRKLTATAYNEWVLGGLRPRSVMHVVCEQDQASGALVARNPYNTELYNRVVFLDTDERQFHFTSNRTEFIGRNGSLANPDAMTRTRLSGALGAGLDPCAAIQVPAELDNGHERVIVFRMGSGHDQREAEELIRKFKGRQTAQQSLDRVRQFWRQTLGIVRVETPDKSINLLANGWLLYQVLSSRLWGRSGFYQSGGAYGFRDQLQDVIALLHARPRLAREQILMAASRQFREGDVQHWWHPPMGRGVRTLCSDDMLWLPYVVSRYIVATGDQHILEEQIAFLQGRQLNVNEESYFDLPIVSDQRATLYDHCKRAIQRALRTGPHGLPLMGSGDWNDGMNMVGIHGTGESVWLAFFLYDVLMKFVAIAKTRDDDSFVNVYTQKANELRESINQHAWDGNWYLRAFFDDGTPLGSDKSDECQIDSISQSWAMLSGAGEPTRVKSALNSIEKRLVNRQKNIIQLLDPPFDKSEMDPGYIKGYVPGVRENGGQYTHAAIWMVMAFARLGEGAKAMELFHIINPVNHGTSPDLINLYKAEPYVVAADVYGVPPHTGRSGWTWYTGSAGWMYQLIVESLLGVTREGDRLRFAPCVPPDWKSFSVEYRFEETKYNISVSLGGEDGETVITVDGSRTDGSSLLMVNDKSVHDVTVEVPVKSQAFANVSRPVRSKV